MWGSLSSEVKSVTLAVLSLGSNIDREVNIRTAVQAIIRKYEKLDISPVYETEAVGFQGPPFLNLVLGFLTRRSVEIIIQDMREIEAAAGRVRSNTFDNRVLDIDVVLFGAYVLYPRYNIPRVELEKCGYVLKPLSDLYPDTKHPVNGQTYLELWHSFDQSSQPLEVIDFNPQ